MYNRIVKQKRKKKSIKPDLKYILSHWSLMGTSVSANNLN